MIHQMGFYGRRMREEAAIRRTGMIFIVLAFMVQFFAVLSPAAITSAAPGPSNDLVNGGFSSAAEAARDCNNNVQDYGGILKNYDITCSEVANSPTVTIASTDDSRDLFSMGRWQYQLTGEQPVTIDGATYYVRYLWAWDKGGPASHYQALRVIAANGTLYYLMYPCGNLVSVGVPKAYSPPAAPSPPEASASLSTASPIKVPTSAALALQKTTIAGYPAANSNVTPGATLGYKIYVDNPSSLAANSVSLSDNLDTSTTFSSQSLNAGATVHTYDSNSHTVHYSWSSVPADESYNYSVDIYTKVNSNVTNGQQICNTASVTATNAGSVNSNSVCFTVAINSTPTVTPVTPTPVSPTPVTTTPCQYDSTIASASAECTPCQYNSTITASNAECKPCEASTTSTDTISCVVVSKTAANLTENVADANNTTAQPGDVILYTLSAQNNSTATIPNYTFQENLGDVMVYATPTDLHGGTLDSNTGAVTWPAADLAAGTTATEQVTVQVKNPIPAAAASPANPGEYDLVMTNVFGNTVNINVPAPAAQSIVTASAALPNTGPGSSLFVIGAVVMITGYFYGRSRLLAKESALAVKAASIG
jgi:uncharacterized repeat protein (TIGR01451 family)